MRSENEPWNLSTHTFGTCVVLNIKPVVAQNHLIHDSVPVNVNGQKRCDFSKPLPTRVKL